MLTAELDLKHFSTATMGLLSPCPGEELLGVVGAPGVRALPAAAGGPGLGAPLSAGVPASLPAAC